MTCVVLVLLDTSPSKSARAYPVRRETFACPAVHKLVVLPAPGPAARYLLRPEGDAMSDSSSDYQLGSADDELGRLELQGRALAPATYMIFDAAGIRPGMRVLDL